MAIFLIDLLPHDMERRLGDALAVYVDAMRYPRGTENQRAAMWLEHIRRRGWQGAAVVEAEVDDDQMPSAEELASAPLLGVAYGYPGAPGQWWQQQVVLGLQRGGSPPQEIARLMNDYFELTELHIHPAPKAAGSARPWRDGCSPVAPKRTCCCPHRKPTASPTAPGACTGGWVSPTSSAATTSPATPGRSRSWAANSRCDTATFGTRPKAALSGTADLAR